MKLKLINKAINCPTKKYKDRRVKPKCHLEGTGLTWHNFGVENYFGP